MVGSRIHMIHHFEPLRHHMSTSSSSHAVMRELHTTVLGEIDCSWQGQKGNMRPVEATIPSEHGADFGLGGGNVGSELEFLWSDKIRHGCCKAFRLIS